MLDAENPDEEKFLALVVRVLKHGGAIYAEPTGEKASEYKVPSKASP